MTDYIIVGGGLAGLFLAEQVRSSGGSFVLLEDESLHTSAVAAGVCNPVILKRYSILSGASQQLDEVSLFFEEAGKRLHQRFLTPVPVLRKFASVAEQNDWFHACDKPGAPTFLSHDLLPNTNPNLEAPFGFGEVLRTGFVDTEAFVKVSRQALNDSGCLKRERFDYSRLQFTEGGVNYQGISARRVVFAEGYGVNRNPYFSWLPVAGTKGEVLTVRIPGLNLDAVVKGPVFLLPLGGDLYRVGATYNWDQKDESPTNEAKEELLNGLREMIRLPFEVVDHKAGIRPTVKDRKPVLGAHPDLPSAFVLNGLGTRGVMLGVQMSRLLFEHIEKGNQLPSEVNLQRFINLYPPSDRN